MVPETSFRCDACTLYTGRGKCQETIHDRYNISLLTPPIIFIAAFFSHIFNDTIDGCEDLKEEKFIENIFKLIKMSFN